VRAVPAVRYSDPVGARAYKSLFLFPLALISCAAPAWCLETPKLTLFAGFSHEHGISTSWDGLNGWTAGLGMRLTPRIRLTANAAGEYGAVRILGGVISVSDPVSRFTDTSGTRLYVTGANVHRYSLRFGPEFCVWRGRSVAINLMVGVGVVHGAPGRVFLIYDPTGSFSLKLPTSFGFSASGGASADLRLSRRISWRLIQSEFVGDRLDYGWERGVRFSTGLVFGLAR
jgi:hypothetical protein